MCLVVQTHAAETKFSRSGRPHQVTIHSMIHLNRRVLAGREKEGAGEGQYFLVGVEITFSLVLDTPYNIISVCWYWAGSSISTIFRQSKSIQANVTSNAARTIL